MFSLHSRAALPLLAGVFASLVAGSTSAATAPPFRELLAETQARAPRLNEASGTVRQAEGLAAQARVRPNPNLQLQVENFGAGSSQPAGSGLEARQTTFQYAQPLELGGKRDARIQAGRAELAAANARREQTRVDYAFDLAVAYSQAEAADRRVAIAEQDRGLTAENLRVTQVLVDAGREARLRAVQVQSTVGTAEAALETSRADRATALASLSALSGVNTAYTDIEANLLDAASSPQAATSDLLTDTSPAVIAAQADVEAARRRIKVQRTLAVPDVTAQLGVRRGDGATAFTAGVSMPLPLFDRNRGNIDAALGELQIAQARLEAAELDARASLGAASSQLRASQARADAAIRAERDAAEAYQLTRTGYEQGKLPLLELLNAQRALTAARGVIVDAQLARVRAEAELARLQGRLPFGG